MEPENFTCLTVIRNGWDGASGGSIDHASLITMILQMDVKNGYPRQKKKGFFYLKFWHVFAVMVSEVVRKRRGRFCP